MKSLLTAVLVATLVGCTSLVQAPGAPVTPQRQTAIDASYASYAALNQAIKAADAAVLNGSLKGQDAERTLKGFQSAKAGLDLALLSLKATAPAASGVPAK